MLRSARSTTDSLPRYLHVHAQSPTHHPTHYSTRVVHRTAATALSLQRHFSWMGTITTAMRRSFMLAATWTNGSNDGKGTRLVPLTARKNQQQERTMSAPDQLRPRHVDPPRHHLDKLAIGVGREIATSIVPGRAVAAELQWTNSRHVFLLGHKSSPYHSHIRTWSSAMY